MSSLRNQRFPNNQEQKSHEAPNIKGFFILTFYRFFPLGARWCDTSPSRLAPQPTLKTIVTTQRNSNYNHRIETQDFASTQSIKKSKPSRVITKIKGYFGLAIAEYKRGTQSYVNISSQSNIFCKILIFGGVETIVISKN